MAFLQAIDRFTKERLKDSTQHLRLPAIYCCQFCDLRLHHRLHLRLHQPQYAGVVTDLMRYTWCSVHFTSRHRVANP